MRRASPSRPSRQDAIDNRPGSVTEPGGRDAFTVPWILPSPRPRTDLNRHANGIYRISRPCHSSQLNHERRTRSDERGFVWLISGAVAATPSAGVKPSRSAAELLKIGTNLAGGFVRRVFAGSDLEIGFVRCSSNAPRRSLARVSSSLPTAYCLLPTTGSFVAFSPAPIWKLASFVAVQMSPGDRWPEFRLHCLLPTA